MQALVDASPIFGELVDRIKAEGSDATKSVEGSKSTQVLLFWLSRTLMDDDVMQKDLSSKDPYTRLLADIDRSKKESKAIYRNYSKDDEKLFITAFPELDGDERKLVLVAMLSIVPVFDYVKKIIKAARGAGTGIAVADIIERFQTRVRDAYVKNRKYEGSVLKESVVRKLKQALEKQATLVKSSSSSGESYSLSELTGTGKAAPGDATAEKIRAVQKQQYTGAVTRDFMVGLANTGSEDTQQMLGGIDARAKELAAHTMSVTFLLTESFRTFSDLLAKVNPGRVLREYEKIVHSLEPIAPNDRRKAAAALELEQAYAVTRQEIEEEFLRMQDRVALTLERVDRARAETLGSQYTW
jgi:alkylhydroperoxidase/carboxymuconolactone decarboxylase family protein YurZ